MLSLVVMFIGFCVDCGWSMENEAKAPVDFHLQQHLQLRTNDVIDLVSRSPCSFTYKHSEDDLRAMSFVDLSPLASMQGTPSLQIGYKDVTLFYNPCFPLSTNLTKECCKGSTICTFNTTDEACIKYGQGSSGFPLLQDNDMFSYSYQNEQRDRRAVVDLICTMNGKENFSLVDEKDKQVTLALQSFLSCPVVLDPMPRVTPSLSIGSVTLLAVFIGFSLYFLGGMLVRKFIGGASGLEVIPNYDFWADLPSLIRDGVMFLFSGCRSSVVYEQI